MCTATSNYEKLSYSYEVRHYSSLTDEQLINDLVNYGPITVGINSRHDSVQYAPSSGLIENCPHVTKWETDHLLLLVGYNTSHWFVKNSWGPYWADQGYAYVRRGAYDCGITSWAD